MRNSKLVAFLLALVLCVVSVAAALADFNDVSEEWIVAMEKKACTILKNEGNNIDYKTLKEVSGSYYGNEYTFFLTSAKGKQYAAAFNVLIIDIFDLADAEVAHLAMGLASAGTGPFFTTIFGHVGFPPSSDH